MIVGACAGGPSTSRNTPVRTSAEDQPYPFAPAGSVTRQQCTCQLCQTRDCRRSSTPTDAGHREPRSSRDSAGAHSRNHKSRAVACRTSCTQGASPSPPTHKSASMRPMRHTSYTASKAMRNAPCPSRATQWSFPQAEVNSRCCAAHTYIHRRAKSTAGFADAFAAARSSRLFRIRHCPSARHRACTGYRVPMRDCRGKRAPPRSESSKNPHAECEQRMFPPHTFIADCCLASGAEYGHDAGAKACKS